MLLDDCGSISLFSSAFSPCDKAVLKVFPQDYFPNLISAHLRFRQHILPETASLVKR